MPAQHFSARTLWDKNKTLWCGFVVEVDGVTFYFAGDSGYTPQSAEIGARFPAIDAALLPIGAYEPRWFMTPVHMNPEEAGPHASRPSGRASASACTSVRFS